MIVFSGIKRCQNPQFTQIVQEAKNDRTGRSEARGDDASTHTHTHSSLVIHFSLHNILSITNGETHFLSFTRGCRNLNSKRHLPPRQARCHPDGARLKNQEKSLVKQRGELNRKTSDRESLTKCKIVSKRIDQISVDHAFRITSHALQQFYNHALLVT